MPILSQLQRMGVQINTPQMLQTGGDCFKDCIGTRTQTKTKYQHCRFTSRYLEGGGSGGGDPWQTAEGVLFFPTHLLPISAVFLHPRNEPSELQCQNVSIKQRYVAARLDFVLKKSKHSKPPLHLENLFYHFLKKHSEEEGEQTFWQVMSLHHAIPWGPSLGKKKSSPKFLKRLSAAATVIQHLSAQIAGSLQQFASIFLGLDDYRK